MDKISAGVLADARRVRNLYRRSFGNAAKAIARRRVVDALRAAGVTVVLDLWGGGSSADFLVAAGFRVISIENGSMKLEDQGIPVSTERKRRAHEIAGLEGGYETFWGEVWEAVAAYPEATGAYLDFCGPWTETTRRSVNACRSMEAVLVTLTPVRDEETSGWTKEEREMSYQLVLKLAWAEKPRWAAIDGSGSVRRLFDYRNPGSVFVFLYLLSHRWLRLPVVPRNERLKARPDMRERSNASDRDWYYRNRESVLAKQRATRPKKPAIVGPCSECGTVFERPAHGGRLFCSDACRHNKRMADQRRRRLAAVSGTTAEAISSEEAA